MRWNHLRQISVVLFVAAMSVSTSLPANALEWGVSSPSAMRRDPEPAFHVMKERGFTLFRIGVNLSKDKEQTEGPMLENAVRLAKIYGIKDVAGPEVQKASGGLRLSVPLGRSHRQRTVSCR